MQNLLAKYWLEHSGITPFFNTEESPIRPSGHSQFATLGLEVKRQPNSALWSKIADFQVYNLMINSHYKKVR